MDLPCPCKICGESSHAASRCPELYRGGYSGGGGGGDDDDHDHERIRAAGILIHRTTIDSVMGNAAVLSVLEPEKNRNIYSYRFAYTQGSSLSR